MKARIVVCGLDRIGSKILSLLKQQGADVVGVHDSAVFGLDSEIIVGDPRSAPTLLRAGIRDAHTLVLSGADDRLNLEVLLQARAINPYIRIVNRLANTRLGERLDLTLPNHVSLSVASLAAPVFGFTALGSEAIGQLKLFERTWPIRAETITEYHPWRDLPLAELWDDRHRMLIYYLPAKPFSFEEEGISPTSDNPLDNPLDLVSAVVHGHRLQVGDRLLVGIRPERTEARLTWGQRLRNLVTGLGRLRIYGSSMSVVALVLVGTIALATALYTTLQPNVAAVDALYFAVGMVTGAGGNEKVVENSSATLKVFTAVTMVVGTAIIGIWYALLTDFILGTRLRQFLDATRIPTENHYVICGLGNLGLEVAARLREFGCEVVAIEQDANGRFLGEARTLGVPVTVGDASSARVLQAANLAGAAGIVAVTNDDMANLEIALTAKGVAPEVRTVLRYEDSRFAQKAEQVFGFQNVLSPTDLVAPSFAAAALGGRVLGNGAIGNDLWVALSLALPPDHVFCGQKVQDVAMLVDFVPLYLEKPGGKTLHGWDLLRAAIAPGDTLHLIVPAARLDELWRVVPSALAG